MCRARTGDVRLTPGLPSSWSGRHALPSFSTQTNLGSSSGSHSILQASVFLIFKIRRAIWAGTGEALSCLGHLPHQNSHHGPSVTSQPPPMPGQIPPACQRPHGHLLCQDRDHQPINGPTATSHTRTDTISPSAIPLHGGQTQPQDHSLQSSKLVWRQILLAMRTPGRSLIHSLVHWYNHFSDAFTVCSALWGL